MDKLSAAIALLNAARQELEAYARGERDAGYRQDMEDIIEDVGAVLVALESFTTR